jgi:hypothetical protein
MQTEGKTRKRKKREYTASAREKAEILQKLRRRLNRDYARIPGHFFMGEWRKQIGPAWPLLGVLLCICDWSTGKGYTYIWALAEVIGVSERQINNWLRINLEPIGVERQRLRSGIAIYLPKRLLPTPKRKNTSESSKVIV